ncbi:hypothetical protein L1987_41983 [Smallanthus sonchifolius]|uniref:Uncharacterized protein n=1 Tax=Smallanthus sonchifolius TaxID=185202 RepID=A0ACB9GWK2_9ASTR|nr:hypothetical protein L1987_41983 [Smallanthus sonchifolius]
MKRQYEKREKKERTFSFPLSDEKRTNNCRESGTKNSRIADENRKSDFERESDDRRLRRVFTLPRLLILSNYRSPQIGKQKDNGIN